MKYELKVIKPSELDSVLPIVLPILARAVSRDKGIKLSTIEGLLRDGSTTLLIVLCDGVIIQGVVIEFIITDYGDKNLHVTHLAGNDIDNWIDALCDVLHNIANNTECSKIFITGARLGWEKVMKNRNGKVVNITIEVSLGE